MAQWQPAYGALSGALALVVSACAATIGPGNAPNGDATLTDAGLDISHEVSSDVRVCDAPLVVPCPTSAAGAGQPCASQGLGCGSVGPCGTVSCACGNDRRWRCTAPNNCDAGSSVEMCGLVGVYEAQVECQSWFFRVAPDGTWRGAPSLDSLDTAPLLIGGYQLMGLRVLLRDMSVRFPWVTCPPSQIGVYEVAMDPSCAFFVLRHVSDQCLERAGYINGALFRRAR